MNGLLQRYLIDVTDCKSMVTDAFTRDTDGNFLISPVSRTRIVKAAFLDAYKAWEAYLEGVFLHFLLGGATLNGVIPLTYFNPVDATHAEQLMQKLGNDKFFDYTTPSKVLEASRLLFEDGYPIADPINGALQSLQDLKTMRNAAAHMSKTARQSFEGLVQRVLTVPRVGIDLSDFLLATMPIGSSGLGGPGVSSVTVFDHYCKTTEAVATAIANGK